jgi:hypothetical protein
MVSGSHVTDQFDPEMPDSTRPRAVVGGVAEIACRRRNERLRRWKNATPCSTIQKCGIFGCAFLPRNTRLRRCSRKLQVLGNQQADRAAMPPDRGIRQERVSLARRSDTIRSDVRSLLSWPANQGSRTGVQGFDPASETDAAGRGACSRRAGHTGDGETV